METPRASLYVWAGVPEGYTSAEFSERVLEERDIFITPGTGYGEHGEGYVRLSLTVADDQLDEAVDRLSDLADSGPRLAQFERCVTNPNLK